MRDMRVELRDLTDQAFKESETKKWKAMKEVSETSDSRWNDLILNNSLLLFYSYLLLLNPSSLI